MTVHLRGMQDKELLLCQKVKYFKNKLTINYCSTVKYTVHGIL